MSARSSFPLIGIDHNKNEYTREWQGRNAEDAAQQLAQFYSYVKVLSGDNNQKRSGNGGTYFRKPLYEAPIVNGFAKGITLGDAMDTGPSSVLFALRMVREPKEMIAILRNQGYKFGLKERAGDRRISLSAGRLKISPVGERENGQIMDFIRDHTNGIIDALVIEENEQNGAAPHEGLPDEPPAPDPQKGKTMQDILLAMFPQMPTPFSVDDLLDRMRLAGYTELAEERHRIQSNVHYAISKGQIQKLGRGKYAVVEEYRHRRATPDESPKEPPKAPDPVVEVAQPEPPDPNLSLELLTPPRDVVEVAAPPEPEPAPEPELAAAPEPPPVVPAPRQQQNVAAALLDLASQAMLGDMTDLASAIQEATQEYEDRQLESLSTLTNKLNSIANSLRKRDATRQAILGSLAG